MPLHDAVGVNCIRAQQLKIKVQVPGIWAKGCVLGDLLPLLDGGRKSGYIIIILLLYLRLYGSYLNTHKLKVHSTLN